MNVFKARKPGSGTDRFAVMDAAAEVVRKVPGYGVDDAGAGDGKAADPAKAAPAGEDAGSARVQKRVWFEQETWRIVRLCAAQRDISVPQAIQLIVVEWAADRDKK